MLTSQPSAVVCGMVFADMPISWVAVSRGLRNPPISRSEASLSSAVHTEITHGLVHAHNPTASCVARMNAVLSRT
jgi:hypothetical protein